LHGRLEARLDAAQLVRPEVNRAGQIAEAQTSLGTPADQRAALEQLDVGGVRFEERRRDRPDPIA